MAKYRFTGDSPEYFPTLGWMAEPGDEREIDADVSHPRLELVEPKRERAAKKEN